MLAKDIAKMVWFCFDYLPSSVEIIDPEHIHYTSHDFSSFLNDLQARMHLVSNDLKITTQKNEILDRNGQNLLRNFILHILRQKDESLQGLSSILGIPEKQLGPFI